MSSDPRDSGAAGTKEWEEFRASFAAAFLLVWLIEESSESLTSYARDLHNRFMSGWDIQETLEHDPDMPEAERGFPLPPVGGVEAEGWEVYLTWMDASEARALYDQLFPHHDSGGDFRQVSAGLAVVALHSAFEAYAEVVGVNTRGRLPMNVEDWLQRKAPELTLDSECMRWLTECDATRHVIIHNRSIVDDRYIRSSHHSGFLTGEVRTVTAQDLHRFASAVWKAASIIRSAIP